MTLQSNFVVVSDGIYIWAGTNTTTCEPFAISVKPCHSLQEVEYDQFAETFYNENRDLVNLVDDRILEEMGEKEVDQRDRAAMIQLAQEAKNTLQLSIEINVG